MLKTIRLIRQNLLLLAVFVVVITLSLQTIFTLNSAEAALLTDRDITLGSSEGGRADVTYSVDVRTATTSNIGGMVIDFCTSSPIIGDTCTAPAGFNINEAGLVIANQVGATGWTVDAATTPDKLVLTRTPSSINSGVLLELDLGSSGGSDGVTNPTANNAVFYARVLTYATGAGAQGYTSTVPGTRVDDGGLALSTAEQIDISARVQETLTFCIGTTNPGPACSGASGSNVDLGVLDQASVNYAAVESTFAYAQLSTNAQSGAVVTYYADELKVTGATCSGTSSTDQCINEAGATESTIVAGTEEFGMWALRVSDGITSNLTVAANYDNDAGVGTPANYADDEYAFIPLATTTLASSTAGATVSDRVLDSEQLTINFVATAAATTPSGLYQTTMTFVATGTF